MFLNLKKAQSILEYVMVIGIITLVLVTMTPYLRRAVQGVVKTASDQLAPQRNSEQVTDTKWLPYVGYLVNSFTDVEARSTKIEREIPGESSPGVDNSILQYFYNDVTLTATNSFVDLGFQERGLP